MMTRVDLTIETSNAAFDESPGCEVARILRKLANAIEDGKEPEKIYDYNGNVVGHFNTFYED